MGYRNAEGTDCSENSTDRLFPQPASGLVTRISKYDTNPANNLSRRSAPASGASALIRESQTTHAPASLAARRVSVKRSGMTTVPV